MNNDEKKMSHVSGKFVLAYDFNNLKNVDRFKIKKKDIKTLDFKCLFIRLDQIKFIQMINEECCLAFINKRDYFLVLERAGDLLHAIDETYPKKLL